MNPSANAPPTEVTVLIVDDHPSNLKVVLDGLGEKGYNVLVAIDGESALDQANADPPHIILLDVMMPGIDGFETCRRLKAGARTREIPVVFMTSLSETVDKVKGFGLGSVDYITKPFDIDEVDARVRYHSRCYLNLIERNAAYRILEAVEKRRAAELEDAANYVRSLLPAKLTTGEIRTEWVFRSSSELGGDAFGYRWLDPDHFVLYLLDVSGHGMGAALLSVSALNVLSSLPPEPPLLSEPAAVLSELNRQFDMEQHHGMYFTLWYGVYDRCEQQLRYASGGHPPALLFPPGEGGVAQELTTGGTVIGGFPSSRFTSAAVDVVPGSRLYLFSDGAFEFPGPDGVTLATDELREVLRTGARGRRTALPAAEAFFAEHIGEQALEDDLSFLEVIFNPCGGKR